MGLSLISNPPYNLKWCIPPFAQIEARFAESDVPPESNANYAFILSGIELITDEAAFLLPCNVLSTSNKQEQMIKKYLVDKNLIDAIILCPDNMFEKTSIGTCILLINKEKKTTDIVFIDMRNAYDIEKREQNGQYGGKSHTNRTYEKNVKIFNDEHINRALECIKKRTSVCDFAAVATMENVAQNSYNLSPARYIEASNEEPVHRSYSDIVSDINRIINEKNACKLTINDMLAKKLGFDTNLYKKDQNLEEVNVMLKRIGSQTVIKENYFVTTKNKNEIKFENGNKDILSSVLMIILNTWKQHIYYLNNEENRYLIELRDAILPDLMSGKIDIENGYENND